eukprot:m.22651 g.22651  ORF g.22651 m.22651 type:complete len:379 (-) comp7422_c0_seq1:63-1199(-)
MSVCRLIILLLLAIVPCCEASGRLFGVSAHDNNYISVTNFTYDKNSKEVVSTTSPRTPCKTDRCAILPGRGTVMGGIAAVATTDGGKGNLLQIDTIAGVVRDVSNSFQGTLNGLHDACEGGCSNGESLAYEHCNYMAVLNTSKSQELVCAMADGTIVTRHPLPAKYSKISGAFPTHTRLMMTNTYCVLAASNDDSAVFCLSAEFDPIANKLETTMSSFHMTVSPSIWGSTTQINPIVTLIGAHPSQPNSMLVLAARKGDAKTLLRNNLYIGVVTGPMIPGNTSKIEHLVDIPAGFVANTAVLSPQSVAVGFLDYDSQYPFGNTRALLRLMTEEDKKPFLLSIPVPYPPSSDTSTQNGTVQSWAWPTVADYMFFQVDRE